MNKGNLILVQVDHVSGETMGFTINRLVELGAKNVQLLQSVTKKNRPGYVLLIDLPAEKVNNVALFLAGELGIWGYHVMDSEHVHFNVSFCPKTLLLKESGVTIAELAFKAKCISDHDTILSVCVEHDFLLMLSGTIREFGHTVSTSVLHSAIESRLWSSDSDEITIDLRDLLRTSNSKVYPGS